MEDHALVMLCEQEVRYCNWRSGTEWPHLPYLVRREREREMAMATTPSIN